MADPISLASGVVALVTFGLQASKSLYDAIESLKNHSKTVRDLKSDLEALQAALRDLEDLIGTEDEKVFVSLKHPVYCCGAACSEFEAVVRNCTTNSSDTHRSIRDWAKLQFKNGEIIRFRTTLAGYKSTIQVVIGGINLRSAKVTQKCLDEYRDLIENTKADLTEHLSDIEEELSVALSGNAVHLGRMKQEQESTKRCLEMCDEVWTYVGQHQKEAIQAAMPHDNNRGFAVHTNTTAMSSSQLTAATFADCRDLVAQAKAELEDRLNSKEASAASSIEPETGPKVSRVQKCLELCDSALREAEQTRVNVFEDVNVADDSKQYIVSTIGDLISAKRVTAGSRTTLVWGQMSDESLQHSFLHLAERAPQEVPPTHTGSTRSFSQYGKGQPVG